jgi:hypothetical protein
MRSNKPIRIYVDPLFKSELKIAAARNNVSVINLTRKIAIDKKLLLEEEGKKDDIVRY